MVKMYVKKSYRRHRILGNRKQCTSLDNFSPQAAQGILKLCFANSTALGKSVMNAEVAVFTAEREKWPTRHRRRNGYVCMFNLQGQATLEPSVSEIQ